MQISAERRPPDIIWAGMDEHYIARMKQRLESMRKVASLSHDPRIVEIVAQTANELEEDIRKLEAEQPETVTIHLEPPTD